MMPLRVDASYMYDEGGGKADLRVDYRSQKEGEGMHWLDKKMKIPSTPRGVWKMQTGACRLGIMR